MVDPFNQVPTDAELVKLVDRLGAQAAKETGHMTLLVAMKEGGKCMVSLVGVPPSGPLHDMAKDVPNVLMWLAQIIRWQQELARKEPRQ